MSPWQRRILTRLRALAAAGRKIVLRSGCTLISCHDDAHEAASEATDDA